ncbi:hypothetical protein GV827_18065 [Sulfitobacter sp. JBTF-M27]|uniref:Uncharacterized protein n=1 Tax=Sulfitobacter sediminilitoris TaxID=2698830 RepID=A0A6P0CIL9_9RHOB|nr:hypothetical protein [Sulfitobacter sediminilitoris]NEK24294.1 hypothetical protein [Sulfitobacter sediminilitoris]
MKAFSDPRLAAVLKQVREAETVQALARLRLVWASYPKRVFLLSNLPVEMPVDHLIEFNDLMPDRLELELLDKGEVPITAKSLVRLRSDLGYNESAARKVVARSNASNPAKMLSALPELVRACAFLSTYRAGDAKKTKQKHLFLPKNFKVYWPEKLGKPLEIDLKLWTNEEILEHLEAGWGQGNVEELMVSTYVPV